MLTEEQRVVNDLILFLKNNNLKIGDRLPSERSFSEQLNTSRTTLRNAFKILQSKGVLQVKAGSGYYLRTQGKYDSILLENAEPHNDMVSESLEAFYLFEPTAVAVATERISEEKLGQLEQCVIDLSKAIIIPDIDNIVSAHKQFHTLIACSTGNQVICNILQRFELTWILVSNMMSRLSPEQRNEVFSRHVHLFNAIKARNADSARAISEKMITTTAYLLFKFQNVPIPPLIRNRLKNI